MLRKKGIYFYTVLLLFVIYLVNGFVAIPQNSVTYDEMDHWSYGKRILKRQPQKIYPFDDASAMPVSGLNAIPRAVQQLADPSLRKTDGGFSDIMHGRYVTVIVCLLIGVFVFQWSKELFGKNAGLLSLFLFVFSPGLNAHISLLTTDAYAALFTISTFYFYWRFLRRSGWKYFLFFCISLALAQLVKQTLLHLFIILAIVSLVVLIKRRTLFSRFKINGLRLIVLNLMVVVIINLGFFFNGTGRPLSDYSFHSSTFSTLGNSAIKDIPLPLPVPFLAGLDITMYMNELGAGDPRVSNKNYLLGKTKEGKGFWYYYLVTGFFKTPLSVLIPFLLIPLAGTGKRKEEGDKGIFLFLGFPILYFLICFGLMNNSQVGVRHVLMIYPLLHVCCGYLTGISAGRLFRNTGAGVLILYSLFTYYRFYPNLLSYHNELIRDIQVYKIMGESNVDFGQSVFRYTKYLQDHPETSIPGPVPAPGRYIESIDVYLGLVDKYNVDWLNRNFKPVGVFDHCYLLFDVLPGQLKEKGLK